MKEASFYRSNENGTVDCQLCPNYCHIEDTARGDCNVRKNIGGKLVTENFGKVSSLHLDPIEKKPLYHFYPGRNILSIGSIGCNLRCNFCQNCEISQISPDEFYWFRNYTPDSLVHLASQETNNVGIAYTYNEPTIFYEFMKETAYLAKLSNMQNVMVSNGYINNDPLKELFPFIDAFNIDLKAFINDFYKEVTGGKLEPVKNTLKKIRKENKHLEITHLLIPKLNDQPKLFRDMVKWIVNELGSDTVLHISRYFPAHRSKLPATPLSMLEEFYEIANEILDYVYLGNLHRDTDTYCRGCGNFVIHRVGYHTEIKGLSESGFCVECGEKIVIS